MMRIFIFAGILLLAILTSYHFGRLDGLNEAKRILKKWRY